MHAAIYTFLIWAKNHDRVTSIVFGYVCKQGLEMIGAISRETALNLGGPDSALHRSDTISFDEIISMLVKLKIRSNRFAIEYEPGLFSLGWVEQKMAVLGTPLVTPPPLAEALVDLFLEAGPRRIFDLSLDDLGAKEIDLILSSLEEPRKEGVGCDPRDEIEQEFERYIEERDELLNYDDPS